MTTQNHNDDLPAGFVRIRGNLPETIEFTRMLDESWIMGIADVRIRGR